MAASDGVPDNPAAGLGLWPGTIVQELGWDSDVDYDLRAGIEEIICDELTDEDATLYESVHCVLLWWRNGDGNLRRQLTEAQRSLIDDGQIWLFTPTAGPDHVDSAKITQSAATAGLHHISTLSINTWTGHHLCRPSQ